MTSLLALSLAVGAMAAEPTTTFDWRTREYATGNRIVGCGIAVTAVRADTYLTVDLSLLARDGRPKHVSEIRLSAGRRNPKDLLQETAAEVLHGWLRSSTGSSERIFREVPTPGEPHFLSSAPGIDPFADLFRGIRREGAIIGVRTATSAGERIERPGPPPKAVSDKLIQCVNRLLGDR